MLLARGETDPPLAHTSAALRGELPHGVVAPADRLRDLRERHAEHVVHHERHALGGGERIEHHEQSHADRLIERQTVQWIRMRHGGERRTVRQRFREPLPHVALAPHPRRSQHIEADAAGDTREPRGRVADPGAFLDRQSIPPHVGLLHGIFRIGHRAEHPVGQSEQRAAFCIE